MDKLLRLYRFLGRFGNLILLGLIILFGVVNRLYMVYQYREVDYIIEIVLIGLAVFLVYRITGKKTIPAVKQKIFKLILIAGIAVRVILAIHDFIDRPVQTSDYAKHEKLGVRIAFEGEFYDFTGVELRNFRQPGLPAIFAVGLWIYNNPVTFAIVMILFSFGVLIAGYYLFKEYLNAAAVISFCYLALSPNMFFMASNSNTQLSFFFFLILIFIILKNYSGKVYQLILLGLFLAAEMYIRFNFLMVFLLVPFLIEWYKEKNVNFSFRKAGVVYLVFIILYSPWVYRNYQIYGTLRLMPTTGLGFYSSNVTTDPSKAGGYIGVPDSVIKKYSHLPEMEFSEALQKDALNYIETHPDIYIKGIPFRLFKYSDRQNWTISYFFGNTNYPYAGLMRSFFESIENLFFWVVIFFSFICLLRIKKLPAISNYILWIYLSYSMALLPISETRNRYHFPYYLFPVFALSFAKRDEETPQTSIDNEIKN